MTKKQKRKNRTQNARLKQAFRNMGMGNKTKPGRAFPFNFLPVAPPSRIGVMNVPGEDGRTTIAPVCLWSGTHVNTRHNKDYIPPRRRGEKGARGHK